MGVMQSRSEPAERLLVGVETAHGSGDYRIDERLRVEEVHQRSDQLVSTARISVRLDDAFDSEEARRHYQPDRRLIVTTDEPFPADREMLFEGYLSVQFARWDGRANREEDRYGLIAEHVVERLARSRRSAVFGRHVRNAEIEDGLASHSDSYAHRSVLMTALPCVFNPEGRPNRAVTPLTVTAPDGQPRSIHLFTWDGAPLAEPWTYATVLRYLLWFYLDSAGPVFEGNAYSVTDEIVEVDAGNADALSAALRREPNTLVCEATNLIEALSLISDDTGLRITADTINLNGLLRTQLRVWSSEQGPVRKIYLARGGRFENGDPRYDVIGRTASEILADNNTYRGEITWDHRRIVNAPIVIGGVKQYELTVPLVPGWVPRDNLDNVSPANRVFAKSLALRPEHVEILGDNAENFPWFQRYHRQGSLFALDADVSRLWVLNEDGYYAPGLYNRNAPFDDYSAFDFSTVTSSSVAVHGAWMRRPRNVKPTISRSTDGGPLGVWVEISFDSGSTWHQQSGGVRVLENRVGIYLDMENPTEITPPGIDPADQNLWYAIIDQTFRVRVTGVIDSDERLVAEHPAAETGSPTLLRNAVLVRRTREYLYVSRTGTTNVLAASSPTADEIDSTTAIEQLAEQLANVNQGREVRGTPRIPWIELRYAIGDRISEIRGRHLRLATTAGADERYPVVLERRFILEDGRHETQLTLGVTEMPAPVV